MANFVAKLQQEDCTRLSIMEHKCNKGHPFRSFVRPIAVAMFNCFAVNVANEANSLIHEEKKRKIAAEKSSHTRKLLKLTSGGSTLKKMPGNEDCGICKFCKDKKKFGGKGTLRKKCEKKT